MKHLVAVFMFLIVSCGEMPEYSPWQSDAKYKNLTKKHLDRLYSAEDTPSIRLALTGDPQVVVGHFKRVIEVTNNIKDINFVAVLGDITDMGLKREWNWVGDIISDSVHPVLTVVGNHDGLTKGKTIYDKMFGPLNYSFIYKDIKFIMWNNNFYEWHDMALDWLEEEVTSHDKVIVMSHQPPYSGTMTHDHEDKWKEIRSHKSYVASLHGHVHNFNYNFEEDTNTIIYTVDRVTGTHFAILTLDEEEIKIENCTPECNTKARVSWEEL